MTLYVIQQTTPDYTNVEIAFDGKTANGIYDRLTKETGNSENPLDCNEVFMAEFSVDYTSTDSLSVLSSFGANSAAINGVHAPYVVIKSNF